jgi:hypothetical protein
MNNDFAVTNIHLEINRIIAFYFSADDRRIDSALANRTALPIINMKRESITDYKITGKLR